MPAFVFRYGTPLLALCCLGMAILIGTTRDWSDWSAWFDWIDAPHLQSFKILFVSIVLEAFPFLLLGVIFSALIQVFVSDRLIRKLTPRRPVAGAVFGGLLGILFPLCECGMIPVVRRLIRKGMPAYIGIVYLLAGPIVNPVVYTSTVTAFRLQPDMAWARMGLGFAVAVVIGLLLYRFVRTDPLKVSPDDAPHIHESGHSHRHDAGRAKARQGRLGAVLHHASEECFDMGKYLIFGALLTALIQTAVGREAIAAIAGHLWLSYAFMAGFAFILSICSTSDAFIAASFNGMFPPGALLAFLVFGPMIDFKNMLMLLSAFRFKIVLVLLVLTVALVLPGAWLIGRIFWS